MRITLASLFTLVAVWNTSAQFNLPDLQPTDTRVGPKGRVIDLQPFLDLEYGPGYQGPAVRMPRELEIDGLRFRIQGQIQVYGHTFSGRKMTRASVRQIPVNGPCEELHVLQGTQWPDADGVKLATIRLNYAGGGHHDFPFVYGRESRDWLYLPSYANESVSSPDTKVVWREGAQFNKLKGYRRLWKTVLRNPQPERRVKSFDIISAYEHGAFTVFGVTIANRNPKRPVTTPPPFSGPPRNFDGRVRVRVVNVKTGKPLVDAHVAPGGSVDGVGVVAEGYRTDANGETIVLYRKAKTASLSVSVYKFGFDGDFKTFRRGSIPDKVTLSISPGQTIGGIARDAEGRAIEGVRVTTDRGSSNGVTDETGRWQIGGLMAPETIQTVTTRHYDYPQRQHAVGAAERMHLTNKTFELRITPGPSILGRVTDDFGRPVAGAKITFGTSFGDSSKQVVYSEGDGRFTIKNLPLGANKLVVQAFHMHPYKQDLLISAVNSDLEIQLAPGGVVKGIVIGADGKPIEGAQVEMIQTGLPSTYRIRQRTKADGLFGLGAAPTGKTTWRISKAEYRTTTVAIPADGTRVKVVLRRTAPLRAR